jgi:UDP-glucose 4-epimerase
LKILITGGAGFVGTNLVKRLVEQGHEVISVDNYSTGLKENHIDGCEYLQYDIRNISDYKFINPDVIFHLAAISRIQPSFKDPKEYFTTNVNGTLNIAKYCTNNNIPLIYAGSSSYHSGKYKNPYTFSKTVGEEVLEMFKQNFGLKYVIARFYNVYGPHQLTEGGYTTLIGRWIGNIQNARPCVIYGDGEQRRDFTHVDDIVQGLIKINSSKVFSIYNGYSFELGRGKNYSINEIAKMFEFTPAYEPAKKGEARNTLCEDTLAKEILGWEPKKELLDYIKPWFEYK